MTRDEITQQIIAARLAKDLSWQPLADCLRSAINFSLNVEKKSNPAGDRVVVTLDGKFLPYDWTAADTAR
jgi:cyanate lyase